MLPHAFTAQQLPTSADAFPTEDYAAQLNPNLSAARRLGRAEVIAKFTMPFTSYSQQLGVSTTVLKRVCAKHGIHKWPYRQLKAIDKRVEHLCLDLKSCRIGVRFVTDATGPAAASDVVPSISEVDARAAEVGFEFPETVHPDDLPRAERLVHELKALILERNIIMRTPEAVLGAEARPFVVRAPIQPGMGPTATILQLSTTAASALLHHTSAHGAMPGMGVPPLRARAVNGGPPSFASADNSPQRSDNAKHPPSAVLYHPRGAFPTAPLQHQQHQQHQEEEGHHNHHDQGRQRQHQQHQQHQQHHQPASGALPSRSLASGVAGPTTPSTASQVQPNSYGTRGGVARSVTAAAQPTLSSGAAAPMYPPAESGGSAAPPFEAADGAMWRPVVMQPFPAAQRVVFQHPPQQQALYVTADGQLVAYAAPQDALLFPGAVPSYGAPVYAVAGHGAMGMRPSTYFQLPAPAAYPAMAGGVQCAPLFADSSLAAPPHEGMYMPGPQPLIRPDGRLTQPASAWPAAVAPPVAPAVAARKRVRAAVAGDGADTQWGIPVKEPRSGNTGLVALYLAASSS